MKKIILSAIVFISLGYNSFGANIYNTGEYNTKPWGCEYSVENHEPGSNVYDLSCYNPGEKICQFLDGTCPTHFPPAGGDGNIQSVVLQQLEAGHLTGTIEFPTGYYTWTGTDETDYKISIVINDVK